MGLGVPELVIIFVLCVFMPLVLVWPAARICKKAGFSPWLGVLIVVPLVNIALLWFVAISEWPSLSPANRGGGMNSEK